MLQRKQTLFLIGIIICNVITMLVPVWTFENVGDGLATAFIITDTATDDIPGTVNNFILLGLMIFSTALTLFIIFLYKNRKMQLKLGLLNILVLISFIILVVMKCNALAENYLLLSPDADTGFGVGYFLPIVAVVLNLLASRYIKKDEELVRSMDRMR